MKASTQDLGDVVATLTPALRVRPIVPKRYSNRQKRDLARALKWNSDRNIIGFGIGPKCVNNRPDYEKRGLVVFVITKLAESRIAKERRIPKRLDLESLDQTITTDVIEVGAIPKLQAIGPGTNAAHFTMRSGSVTAVMVSTRDRSKRALLSCCHVFAPPGRPGTHVESPPDPSAITFGNKVAEVIAAEPLRSGGNVPNVIDAALAEPIAGAPPLSNAIRGLGTITSISALRTGQFVANGIRRVVGVGAVSGVVNGDIIAEPASTLLADPSGARYLFTDLVAYRPNPVTQGGDSGMPILIRTPTGLQLLGMHIGLGQVQATRARAAFFVPLARVVDRFAVDLAP